MKSNNMRELPQFSLKITKPGTAFIQIRQLGDFETTFKGNNKFAFICSDEKGEKMMKINRRRVIQKSKMSDVIVKGDEVFFDKSHSYPKVFTLVVATGGAEPVSSGPYNFEIAAFTKEETKI